jgi:hypothetical protein
MTQKRKKQPVCVATERFSHALDFCKVNGVPPDELCWMGAPYRQRTWSVISEVWVIGEIGAEQQAEVHIAKAYKGAVVRYAEPHSRVSLNRG